MGSDQHFCLRWNNFHSNIAASFEHLRDHEEFVDVTLACEGRSLKAHKVVLSACSPYFKNLLKQNPCQHPIIILRDVAFPDLSALLSFVYQGEVYVSQDRLPAFLRTAEMLHIKGLTEQNQHSSPSQPISFGPSSSTTIMQATHEQGILNNKSVSSVGCSGSGPTSPRSRTPTSPSLHIQQLPVHVSPPPKKRRSNTSTISVLSGSPTTTTTVSAIPSTPPKADLTQRPDNVGPCLEGSTLAAALTKPLTPSGGVRPEGVVAAPHSSSHQALPSLLPASACPISLSLSSSSPEEVPKVKLETEDLEDVKEEEEDEDGMTVTEEAVNLVMEGSILRQRIQGYHQGSPDAPQPHITTGNGRPPSQTLMIPLPHDDSSLDDNFYIGDGCGGETGSDGAEQERESMASSPMVIRSPLVGLIPRDTTGLYGGAGTSGSLSHHDSTQDVVLNLSTGCSPKDTKKWPSRQPVNCQFCGVRISMAFNLRNHVKRCKMRPYSASTGQSIRGSAMSCVPQTHQQQSQSEETSEDTSFHAGGSNLPSLQQTLPQQVLAVDPHQLLPSRSQNATSTSAAAAAAAAAATPLTITPAFHNSPFTSSSNVLAATATTHYNTPPSPSINNTNTAPSNWGGQQ